LEEPLPTNEKLALDVLDAPLPINE
jgi:hypothetical protein